MEAIDVPGLIEPASRILGRLGITGMVEVEFIRDWRDGQHRLLDVNPRPWGWHTLCIACGLDFPLMQYDHSLGRPVPKLAPHYGPRWIRLRRDGSPSRRRRPRGGGASRGEGAGQAAKPPWRFSEVRIDPTRKARRLSSAARLTGTPT